MMRPEPPRHPAWSFWWPALVAFSMVPVVLLATGAIGWWEMVSAIAFLVLMALLIVALVVPLWRSALRDLARWSRSQD
jgi:hypothetical protein